MKKTILALCLTFALVQGNSQTNMTLLGHLDYNPLHQTGTSNLWGYVDELGNEYAIVGTNDGTSVVDVTDPSNPTELWFEADNNSVWREVKVWQDYAYVTTEEEVGLLIIDLSPLPQSTTLPTYRFFGPASDSWLSAHSLFIDENGILYIHGADRGNGGAIFYDLTVSPTNPPEVGQYDAFYVHDSYARGDTLYLAHITDGFFTILDVSDKANPVVMATQTTPSIFTHNAWLTDDGKHLFTTDEVSNAWITSYDITDLSNITEVDRTKSYHSQGSIPHNTIWHEGYLYTSYYRDGVVIHDVTDPSNMIEVAHYDVSPMSGDGFNSVWGVYPFLPSGNVLLSDMENGLYILGKTLVQGCYLHGTITDANTSNPVNNVSIRLLGTSIADVSNLQGDYRSGIVTAGSYDIAFSRSGYEPDTVFNVSLANGDTTILNVQLVPLVPITITGQVVEEGTSTPVPNAQVDVFNDEFSYSVTTDASGVFTIFPAYEGTYEVIAGKWGFVTWCNSGLFFNGSSGPLQIELPVGYYDDFHFDFGWTVSGNAASGQWVRDVPIPSGLAGGIPVNPWFDVSNDCGEKVFVTGNSTGSVGTADVDGGRTILTSPVFDASTFTDPWMGISQWFFNGGGNGNPNDTMYVKMTSGITTVALETLTINNFRMSQWVDTSFQISSFLAPTATMQLIVEASDMDVFGGHLLEASIDRFYLSEGNVLSSEGPKVKVDGVIYPNPSNDIIFVKHPQLADLSGFRVLDLSGRQVLTGNNLLNGLSIQSLIDGMYLLELQFSDRSRFLSRFLKN